MTPQSPQTLTDATRTSLPVTTTLLSLGSSNFDSPDGSNPDLDGLGVRSSSTVENELNDILTKPRHSQRVSQFDLPVNTISTSVGNLATKFAELERNLGTLAACILALEREGRGGRYGSASRVSGSPASSWPSPSHNGGSSATFKPPAQWTITEIRDEKFKQTRDPHQQMMKTHAVPSFCASRALKVGRSNAITIPQTGYEI